MKTRPFVDTLTEAHNKASALAELLSCIGPDDVPSADSLNFTGIMLGELLNEAETATEELVK